MFGFAPGGWGYPSDKMMMSILIGIGAIGIAASTPNWRPGSSIIGE
jgi:hypothetical protein